MSTKTLLLTAWELDAFVAIMCALALGAFVWLARRDGTHLARRAAFFATALSLFALAFVSPVGALSRGYLFSAHMLQHLLLVLVVPPLALLAFPKEGIHKKSGEETKPNALRHVASWGLGVGAMWLWHAPTLCDAAAQSTNVQRLQTISLMLMGGAFFWPILGPRASSRLTPFGGMLYLFTACTGCTLLGILVTFSPVQVCSVYAHPVDRLGALSLIRDGWGLTPKADQEIGGLLMWVPGCMIYAGSIVAMYARYLGEESSTASTAHGLGQGSASTPQDSRTPPLRSEDARTSTVAKEVA
jgi:cytochrome c oxidase assembly factor CtaG